MSNRPRPTVDTALLKAWRDERGWSQSQAAEALGISKRGYQYYETVRCPRLVWMAVKWYDQIHKIRVVKNG